MSQAPRCLVAFACLFALAGVAPAVASAQSSPQSRMLDAINATRIAHGLPAVAPAPRIAQGSSDWASFLATRSIFRHAKLKRPRGYRSVAEIIGLSSGAGVGIPQVVAAWLASPHHRPIVLGRAYDHVGVGMATRGDSTYWVLRFAAR
jgi:uncharacterized protein YkwD